MKTAVACKKVRGGQGPGGIGLGGRREDSGFRVQREAIRGVLNRRVSSAVKAHWWLYGDQIVGTEVEALCGPMPVVHDGLTTRAAERWRAVDGSQPTG